MQEKRLIRRSMAAWARYKGFEPAAHHLLIINEVEQFLEDPSLRFCFCMLRQGARNRPTSAICCRRGTSPTIRRTTSCLPPTTATLRSAGAVGPERHHQRERRAGNFHFADQRRGRSVLDPARAANITRSAPASASRGFRADLGLCDDLFGNREDAWSDTVRQKRWDWYVDDFGPRLKPGAKRILMNTSWHELDVAGRVIAQIESGQVKGKVIDIAAIAGDDDPVGRQARRISLG